MNNKKTNVITSLNSLNEQMLIYELRAIKVQFRELNKNKSTLNEQNDIRIQQLEENLKNLNLKFLKIQQQIRKNQNEIYSKTPFAQLKRVLH